MSDLENARSILQVAKRDLKNLKDMAENPGFMDDFAYGFFAQQAVEKASKAWLSLLGVDYPKTHKLDLLFRLIQKQNVNFPQAFLGFLYLTNFAVEFRYDSGTLLIEEINRAEVYHNVEAFLRHVESLMTG